ncbi:hypothetical protein AN958_06321 [Leucoagaricus sp. SymC.cos]|nr:hypothetical protein AN958_06321 [Leucoagaricus sp. SymC.cos]
MFTPLCDIFSKLTTRQPFAYEKNAPSLMGCFCPFPLSVVRVAPIQHAVVQR